MTLKKKINSSHPQFRMLVLFANFDVHCRWQIPLTTQKYPKSTHRVHLIHLWSRSGIIHIYFHITHLSPATQLMSTTSSSYECFVNNIRKCMQATTNTFSHLTRVHLQTSTFTDSRRCASMSVFAVYFAVGILVISYTVPLWEYLYSAFFGVLNLILLVNDCLTSYMY